ncbi:helix-turn-helix transcriptional regulator [Raineyella sp. LH-20]|uniref:helix-turn-helix transcriptional regulator n=1 Tax=Raineyella sp. LH-20 TaxID=3081204 RepID=UPI002953D0C3|nr:helix-turn-helix transcriptional regulator [Raineyella sp. LH-20]WOP17568.1 helix-turn-helix transcriptional regulator [Raineyella sp. LH-20]
MSVRDEGADYQEMVAEERLVGDVTEHIAEAMEQRGVSKADLAKLCGVGRSAITQRLTGRTNLTLRIVASTLYRLGFGLEVALVDRQHENRTTRLRDYEAEFAFAEDRAIDGSDGVVVRLPGIPWEAPVTGQRGTQRSEQLAW